VEAATGGKVTIEIFPNMQLGGEVEMIKQVLTGSLDITSPSNAPLTNFVPALKIFDMPFLFRDEAHMIKVLRGPVLQDIAEIVATSGIRLLGVYNVGVRHIMSNKPVRTMDDLKGLKIRTMQSKYHMAAFNAFGANATPISYAELYSSLQTGVVDGAEAANTNYFEKKFYEVAPYWGQVGWTILTAPLIMSEKKFASLPSDVQQALLEGGNKAAAWEQDYYASVDKGRLDDVRNAGVSITKLDIAPFQKASEKVYAEFLTTDDERRILKMIQDTK
jgi:tripartite ATP-independent transporter DctP family solute receptor